MAKVLRTFRDAPSGRIVHPGDVIEATPIRHEELAADGLVEAPTAGAKAAEPALNKMAAPHADKAITVTAPIGTLMKRGPGRPAGAKSGVRGR